MPQSLAHVYLHIIFSTKERKAYLQNPAISADLHNYLGATCRNLDCPSLGVGGAADHVHILCRLSRTLSVAQLVRELKRESSKMGENQGWRLGQLPLVRGLWRVLGRREPSSGGSRLHCDARETPQAALVPG